MLSEKLRKAKIRQDVSRLNTDIRDLDFDEIADGFNLKDDPEIYKLLKELSQREVLRAEIGDYHDIIPDPKRPDKWTLSEYKESDPVLTHNQQNDSLQRYLASELSGGDMPSLPMDTNPKLIAELEQAVKALMSPKTLEKFGGRHGMHEGTRKVAEQPGVMGQYAYDLGLGYDRVYRDLITHQKPNQGHIVPNSESDVLTHLKEDLRLQGGHLNQILQNAEGSEMALAVLDQLQGRRYVTDADDLTQNLAEIKEIQYLRKLQKQKETRQKNKELKMELSSKVNNMTGKRFADDSVLGAYRQALTGSTRADSPGANRERSLVIDSGGGDVTIEEGVLRSNGKNGNGNGNGNGKH